MDRQPFLSVIIPVYNKEKYIEECIDSVLNQTFKDLELILIDDESPDRCPQICDAYALKDTRVHVIHQKNMGHSYARNSGIRASKGKYLMFVDSDDYLYDNEVLKKLCTTAETNGSDIVLSNILSLDNDVVSKTKCSYFQYDYQNSDAIRTLVAMYKNHTYHASMCSRIFRRGLITENNLYFKKLICDDEEWTPKVFYFAENIIFADVDCYVIRHLPDSVTAIVSEQNFYTKVVDRSTTASETVAFFAEKDLDFDDMQVICKYYCGMFFGAVIMWKNKLGTKTLSDSAFEVLCDNFKKLYLYINKFPSKYKIIFKIFKIFGIGLSAKIFSLIV